MPSRLGRFHVLRRLGEGALGEIHLAEDPVMGGLVALRAVRAGASDPREMRARLEQEAQERERLAHPGVVQVLEVGQEPGSLYLATEFIDGEDLRSCRRGKDLAGEELELLAQLCDVLAEAHALGIVHGDLKPSNLKVELVDGRLRLRVMDFRALQLAGLDLSGEDTFFGALGYMAPECLRGGQPLPASDLFAVGVLLHEGLAQGRRPFAGGTPSILRHRILVGAPDPLPAAVTSGAPPILLEILRRSLAKDPAERYAIAMELAADLRTLKKTLGSGRTPARPGVELPSGLPGSGLPAKVLVVAKGGQGDCLSLGVALRRAEAGTLILVRPGTYRESLLVDKPVEIRADGSPGEVVLEGLGGPCLTLRAEGVRIDGITLLGARGESPSPAVEATAGVGTLEDCTLSAGGTAAVVVGGDGTRLSLDHCRFQESPGAGIHILGGGEGRLERCTFASLGGAAVLAEQGGQLNLLRCTIHHTQGGVLVQTGARGLLEACNLYQNARSSVRVRGATEVLFRRCRIHDGQDLGVVCEEGGEAAFEECDIYGNAAANVHLLGLARPRFLRCRIHDGPGYGILATEAGEGLLEACEISGHKLSALVISGGADPELRGCRIHGGQATGVNVNDEGKGLLEDCVIEDNLLAGLKVGKGGDPLLRRCRLVEGRGEGAWFQAQARGTLEDCEVEGNAKGGLLIAKDASPTLRGCRLADGIQREGGMLGRLGF